MSFGFGVGDFLAVLQLASEVRQRWSDAPGEYAAARNEIKQLERILEDLNDLSERVDISATQKNTLAEAIANCKVILVSANNIVDTYSTSSSNRLRRTWKRFKLDPDDVRHIRGQLVSVVAQLQVIQNNIQIDLDREILVNVQDLKVSNDNDNRVKIANWFSPPTFAEQQTAQLNLRQAGTVNWFLQHPTYIKWRDGLARTLFCPGIAGSGKSVIFASVVNDIQDHFEPDPDVIVTYFYCNYKRKNEQSFSQILSALVRQLFQEQFSVPDFVQTTYDKHLKRSSQPSVDELHLLVDTLAKAYSKIYILIDALDECTDDDNLRTREKLLAYLINLQNQDKSNFSILVTSRPGITRQFDTTAQIEIRAQPEDVEQYLNATIASVVPCVSNNPIVQKQITQSITSIVDGMFLLARLHLESLRDKTKIRTVLKALETLPQGSGSAALDKAYDEVLERINQQLPGFKDLARKTLMWVTHARRELSLDELREALTIEPGMIDIDPQLDLDDEQTVIAVCAGLIVVDPESEVVRFAHYTTQEYLESHQERWLPDGRDYVARSCIDYLSMQTFYDTKPQWRMNLWLKSQRYKLLHYVGENWGFHCRELEDIHDYAISTFYNDDFLCLASQLAMGAYNTRRMTYTSWTRSIKPLHMCAHFDDLRAMHYLLEDGHDVNCTDGYSRSALHIAAIHRRTEFVKQLLMRHDINVNIQDGYGRSPLSYAARYGHTEVITQLLIRDDIEVNTQDEHGNSPLSYAADNGHVEAVAQLLTRRDIDINIKDKDGHTPLSSAASGGYTEVVAELLARENINVNTQDKDGVTPLFHAARDGYIEVVLQLLARRDINVNIREYYGKTPLSLAARNGWTGTVTQLLERHDIDVNTQDLGGDTPLSFAAYNGHTEIVTQLLLRQDVDVNTQDANGQTPLSLAARNGYTEVVIQLLRRKDIDVNKQDKVGNTPLAYAAGNGDTSIVTQLLARDDIKIGNDDKELAENLAKLCIDRYHIT